MATSYRYGCFVLVSLGLAATLLASCSGCDASNGGKTGSDANIAAPDGASTGSGHDSAGTESSGSVDGIGASEGGARVPDATSSVWDGSETPLDVPLLGSGGAGGSQVDGNDGVGSGGGGSRYDGGSAVGNTGGSTFDGAVAAGGAVGAAGASPAGGTMGMGGELGGLGGAGGNTNTNGGAIQFNPDANSAGGTVGGGGPGTGGTDNLGDAASLDGGDIDGSANAQVLPPQLLVTVTRPAGTLDNLPEFTWTLQAPSGTTLEVRAQAPGDAAPGTGFAGVRPATGAVRYLGPDGQWSVTEVTYANPAPASGTLLPTAPLPIEGEWRFDFIARDADGVLQAISALPLVLTHAPALRVALSRQAALDGDAINGSVVLASGGSSNSLRVMAWWQAPDGTATRLPTQDRLLFDGPAQDVRLEALTTRLQSPATSTWTLFARLFDATSGALLGAGSQSMQVCAGSSTLSGTVLANAGGPLGAGATFAELKALSLDRLDSQVATIAADGSFALDLRPGGWMVSAQVTDSTGMQLTPTSLVEVGCTAPAPLVLTANAPVFPPAAGGPQILLARRPAIRLAPQPAAGGSSCGQNGKVTMRLLGDANPQAVSPSVFGQLKSWLAGKMSQATSGNVMLVTEKDLAGVVALSTLQQMLGEDDTTTLNGFRALTGGDVFAALTAIPRTGGAVEFRLGIYNSAAEILRLQTIKVPATQNPEDYLDPITTLVQQVATLPDPLVNLLRGNLDYPVEPQLSFGSVPTSVLPDSQHDVTVHLQDCDGSVVAGKTVELSRGPVSFAARTTALTDANGDAHFSVLLGAADREEDVYGSYHRATGAGCRTEDHRYAVQRGQSGQLQFGPNVPMLQPNSSATVQLLSQDPVTGAPQANQPVTFQANLGGQQTSASPTTDGNGSATVQVQAGPTPGLGELDAALPSAAHLLLQTPAALRPRLFTAAGAGAAAPGSATEFVVVSSPVALNFNGPATSVLAGAVVTLSGSLLLDGLPLAGTPISFALAGSGNLSATQVAADDNGAFSVDLQLPPDGSGSATVTASTEADGLPVTRDVTVTWTGGVTKIAYAAYWGNGPQGYEVGDSFSVNPDGTGKVQLTNCGSRSAYCGSPAWSPDGTKIAYQYYVYNASTGTWPYTGYAEIHVMNADGSGDVNLSNNGQQAYDGSPAWSPDGTHIAFSRNPYTGTWYGPTDVYTMNANGGSLTQITHAATADQSYWSGYGYGLPSWSPDGSRLVFYGSTIIAFGLYFANADGSGFTNFTQDQGGTPAWSHDGVWIAFSRSAITNGNGQRGIWVIHPDGTGLKQLSAGIATASEYAPSWSPGDTRIAFYTDDLQLVTMSASGGDEVVVGTGLTPSWSPYLQP